MKDSQPTVAMVFAGGLGLAAYQAGVYQAFSERGRALHWGAGSSAGAVTAALIAGNRRDRRIERLRAFWNCLPAKPVTLVPAPWRHLSGWMGAIRTRLVGSTGHFHPRIPPINPFGFRSLYDLAPMKQRMSNLIDFGHLNSGELRVCVAATDIETGEPVIFDSKKSPIEMDHLLLSYRPGIEEPGPEKSFDLSPTALAQRWRAGFLDMQHSDHTGQNEDIAFVRGLRRRRIVGAVPFQRERFSCL
jgi:predicted acylesterase/phospholipase RssA